MLPLQYYRYENLMHAWPSIKSFLNSPQYSVSSHLQYPFPYFQEKWQFPQKMLPLLQKTFPGPQMWVWFQYAQILVPFGKVMTPKPFFLPSTKLPQQREPLEQQYLPLPFFLPLLHMPSQISPFGYFIFPCPFLTSSLHYPQYMFPLAQQYFPYPCFPFFTTPSQLSPFLKRQFPSIKVLSFHDPKYTSPLLQIQIPMPFRLPLGLSSPQQRLPSKYSFFTRLLWCYSLVMYYQNLGSKEVLFRTWVSSFSLGICISASLGSEMSSWNLGRQALDRVFVGAVVREANTFLLG